MHKKIKIILILIVSIVIIILALFIRKYYLISSILNHLKDNEKSITNYKISYDMSHQIYAKDGQFVLVMSDSKIYVNYNNKAYFVNNLEKTYIEDNNLEQIITNFLNPLDCLNNTSILKLIGKLKVSTDTIDGFSCYHITFEKSEYWIRKDNYFPIQNTDNIEINCVTEEMMQLPDLSEYTLQES